MSCKFFLDTRLTFQVRNLFVEGGWPQSNLDFGFGSCILEVEKGLTIQHFFTFSSLFSKKWIMKIKDIVQKKFPSTWGGVVNPVPYS